MNRMDPKGWVGLVAAALVAVAAAGCDNQRKQECSQFLGAMKPLDEGMPSADTVDTVSKQVGAMKFQDQPLGVYATNYRKTLDVLSSTLKLKASGSAPDGTDDVIKKNLKEARTDKEDVQRYCAQ
jgi:hypothetical protein